MAPIPEDHAIILFKPRRLSSRAAASRLLADIGFSKKTKWGHVGTLDPDAAGLLPIFIRTGTRFIPFFEEMFSTKTYLACVAFGSERAGDDASGAISGGAMAMARAAPWRTENSARMSARRVREILKAIPSLSDGFLKLDRHVPPARSAKKIGGRRAYDMAADDARLERIQSSAIVVSQADHLKSRYDPRSRHILSWWRFRVSRGGYIRTLARAAGQDLCVGGHLTFLARQSVGALSADRLAFARTPSGMKYATVPIRDFMAEAKTEILAPMAKSIMSGEAGWIHMQPADLIRPAAVSGSPYVFGHIAFNGRAYAVIFRPQGPMIHAGQKTLYKVLKRIEIPYAPHGAVLWGPLGGASSALMGTMAATGLANKEDI